MFNNRLVRGVFAVSAVAMLSACGNTGVDTSAGSSDKSSSGGAQTVISYNSPAEWGNFGEVHAAFKDSTGIDAPNDPKNSGQALAALQAEKASPVADVVYTGIAFGGQLVESGVLQPHTPKRAGDIADDLKSADEMWHTVHSGTVAFIVNEEFLGGAPVPSSWADLLKPEYKGKVGFLDPTQAAVGYSVATAANEAMGGSLDDFGPGLDYIKQLVDNGAIISAQTATAKVAQGEIPILIDADFNGYKLRDEGSNVSIIIPEEGSLQIPYVVGLVNGAPHDDNGKALLDFYFSEEGQSLFAHGYMRPAVGEIPADMRGKFLPEEDYERARTVNYLKQGEVQQKFNEDYKALIG
ncbi:Putative 2-aminoethylphosphonate-binding periplasmic protein precursor [Corynebacterium glaucum]|uniref:extracellular solute-binding protein n=2 Tax=Corynebacterium glaucum TaxID=187491 RepID=UPI0031E2F277|nr:Putative 2-aminoethylphosphonate-binding periplasmic protein precursor [Corynebacterium glaucum]